MKLTIDDVRSRFIKHFDGSTGSVYASPGRINLIGEHTDYNNGFVFPGAVGTYIASAVWLNLGNDTLLYSTGEYKTVVIICVLTNQVNTTRRSIY